ncbi:hypothetical protein JAAARDRAFT_219779 [Jaapia argillacea MUCL 33604]|uniref:Uncharacterized protein n=1 Tax=Jaapia argillacea MUCL 33604 TaxID=933084 RepID=A0A067QAY5_9AGAM|nr:hypothetical protein JAAARDRAFT_219779 [Jaapia argillacea MUCL 33604]
MPKDKSKKTPRRKSLHRPLKGTDGIPQGMIPHNGKRLFGKLTPDHLSRPTRRDPSHRGVFPVIRASASNPSGHDFPSIDEGEGIGGESFETLAIAEPLDTDDQVASVIIPSPKGGQGIRRRERLDWRGRIGGSEKYKEEDAELSSVLSASAFPKSELLQNALHLPHYSLSANPAPSYATEGAPHDFEHFREEVHNDVRSPTQAHSRSNTLFDEYSFAFPTIDSQASSSTQMQPFPLDRLGPFNRDDDTLEGLYTTESAPRSSYQLGASIMTRDAISHPCANSGPGRPFQPFQVQPSSQTPRSSHLLSYSTELNDLLSHLSGSNPPFDINSQFSSSIRPSSAVHMANLRAFTEPSLHSTASTSLFFRPDRHLSSSSMVSPYSLAFPDTFEDVDDGSYRFSMDPSQPEYFAPRSLSSELDAHWTGPR